MTTSAEPFPASAAVRLQIGGVVGAGPDAVGVARLGRALGQHGLLLDESTTFAWEKGEWTNPESYYPI